MSRNWLTSIEFDLPMNKPTPTSPMRSADVIIVGASA
jgi:hypothetical protein